MVVSEHAELPARVARALLIESEDALLPLAKAAVALVSELVQDWRVVSLSSLVK